VKALVHATDRLPGRALRIDDLLQVTTWRVEPQRWIELER
jgi:hypothetical protein